MQGHTKKFKRDGLHETPQAHRPTTIGTDGPERAPTERELRRINRSRVAEEQAAVAKITTANASDRNSDEAKHEVNEESTHDSPLTIEILVEISQHPLQHPSRIHTTVDSKFYLEPNETGALQRV